MSLGGTNGDSMKVKYHQAWPVVNVMSMDGSGSVLGSNLTSYSNRLYLLHAS